MAAYEEKHPADEIGKALSRAGGILSSLSHCYEKSDSDFKISLPFVFEAVNVVEKLLGLATDELSRLCASYNLSKLSALVETAADEQHATEYDPAKEPVESFREEDNRAPLTDAPNDVPFRMQSPESESHTTPYLGFFGPTEQVSRLASRLDNILEAMPTRQRTPTPEELFDRPAQTYNELLEKLTAMADAAAYQANHSHPSDQTLLPLLETLRADMLRIRSVA